MNRINNYNFNLIDDLSNKKEYNIILIIYSDENSMLFLLREHFKIDNPKNLISMYKDSNSECIIFNINNVKYILVSNKKTPKIVGIIGKNMLNDERKNNNILVIFQLDNFLLLSLYINNLLQGIYRFEELKTIKPVNINIDFNVKDYNHDEVKKMIGQNNILYDVRDLVNLPVNILNSKAYDTHIRTKLNQAIKIKVLDKKQLESEGLNLLLAINKGSKEEPKMIILDYDPPGAINKTNPICLVGKGVMYDTGGLNLKPGPMTEMKTDMVGSAIVYGVLQSLALHQCNKRVIGILLIVQNEIGSSATHPGDVIKSYSGKTVEITDTDAEGRVILADGIAYCKNYNPSLIIDIGSLTDQVCHIFNNLATGFMCNNTKIKDTLNTASMIENEKVWELPLWHAFVKHTKSDVADYCNYSYNKADTIMCGTFLYNFLPDKSIPWLHLDIGGVSYNDTDIPTKCSGATGSMLNTLSRFVMDIQINELNK